MIEKLKALFASKKKNKPRISCFVPKGYIAYFYEDKANNRTDIVVERNERAARRIYTDVIKKRIKPTSIPIKNE